MFEKFKSRLCRDITNLLWYVRTGKCSIATFRYLPSRCVGAHTFKFWSVCTHGHWVHPFTCART